MRTDIVNFPPPVESGQILGHDGTLTTEEVSHLESLGYVVAPYKSFSGQKLMQAFYEGVAKGLIAFDAQTFKAMEAIRKQMVKMDADDSELKDNGKVAKVDVVTLLKNKGAEVEVEQKPRRGRPPNR